MLNMAHQSDLTMFRRDILDPLHQWFQLRWRAERKKY